MSAGEQRYPLEQALAVAGQLLMWLAPACERIEVAGSCRRRKPDVGDLELLCIPRAAENLFYKDALDEAIKTMMAHGLVYYRLNKNGSIQYGPSNKLLVHLGSGIPVDIFSIERRYWGMGLVMRTGPAEFNIRMMSRFRELGMRGHAYAGISSMTNHDIECPDEATVFRHLGWPYLEPEERK